ncbi:coiled-coil domain-containing protein 138-like [Engraulis encrasicolus]|uniref:coiled-coil domain-containing protein 138-like n=1 Tax=Engraulis encrasicolus TaxID=184585 RepID=UPI002FD35B76
MDRLSETDIDTKVERLKKKYLERRPLTGASPEKKSHDDQRFDSGVGKRPNSRCDYRELESHCRSHQLQKAVTDLPTRVGRNNAPNESDDDLNIDYNDDSFLEPDGQCTDTDVTLPSILGPLPTPLETPHLGEKLENHRQDFPQNTPSDLGHVHKELQEIYGKLQCERLHQQKWAAQLLKREQKLDQRESLLVQYQDTLLQVCGAEGGVHGYINAIQQQHQIQLDQLDSALREKTKENKRIKSSFSTIKNLNESMRKQLTDLGEEKKRSEEQLKKVQARLENLQRKYDFAVAQKGRENICPKLELKPSRPDKAPPVLKPAKVLSSGTSGRLLALLLDWVVVDSRLVQAPGKDDGVGCCAFPLDVILPPSSSSSSPLSLQERCAKALPVLAEQLQQTADINSFLHLPLLKVSYWSLVQLDQNVQNRLTATVRRLGEEMTRCSADPGGVSKARPCALFRSPCRHTRFLSMLIILKTITQVDTLAQALEALLVELRAEEGPVLFLHYQAVPVISALLRRGSPGLLGPALDVLMTMCGESAMQKPFLEACSSEDFFSAASLLLRNTRLELPHLEKIVMLLHRLSAMRRNKRLFEAFSLHLVLQEKHRTVDPAHTFLSVSLSAILFNLGMLTQT